MRAYFFGLGSDELLLFFSGAASAPEHFEHLKLDGIDVLFFYDYLSSSFDFAKLAKKYKKIYISAWSMGVAVASRLDFTGLDLNFSLAINGSGWGVHKVYGIHKRIFQNSILNFDAVSFALAMGYPQATMLRDDYQAELSFLLSFCLENEPKNLPWQRVLVSKDDLIFPANAILKECEAFGRRVEILNSLPHFVFLNMKSWRELC